MEYEPIIPKQIPPNAEEQTPQGAELGLKLVHPPIASGSVDDPKEILSLAESGNTIMARRFVDRLAEEWKPNSTFTLDPDTRPYENALALRVYDLVMQKLGEDQELADAAHTTWISVFRALRRKSPDNLFEILQEHPDRLKAYIWLTFNRAHVRLKGKRIKLGYVSDQLDKIANWTRPRASVGAPQRRWKFIAMAELILCTPSLRGQLTSEELDNAFRYMSLGDSCGVPKNKIDTLRRRIRNITAEHIEKNPLDESEHH